MARASPAARLIAWQRRHGRHDLPWQNTRDAYAVWLSEIMLQQTQVATVIPYYRRFLQRYPTVDRLAAAPLDDVLALWSGLGYYSRARNLHRAAGVLVAQYGGRMPRDVEQVQALPGIGRSTAAAICVFAYGARHAILDGNVKRVLARYYGVKGFPGEKKIENLLWEKAQAMLPCATSDARRNTQNIIAYTQGMMDLGAGLCSRAQPQCARCPLRADCMACAQGLTASLPTRKPRAARPQRATVMLVLRHAGEILLQKRAARGIWGGLWSLPEVQTERAASGWCREHLGARVLSTQRLPVLEHGFTHFRLDIAPLLLEVNKPARTAAGCLWLTPHDALGAALPAPVREIFISI
jgi:A/G-specific adenine glycosylase